MTALLVRSPTRCAELRTALEEFALDPSSDAAAASRFISVAPPIYTVLIDSGRQLPQRERLTYLSLSALRRGDGRQQAGAVCAAYRHRRPIGWKGAATRRSIASPRPMSRRRWR